MTERERLLEKLSMVKALAERGEGGERKNAAELLARMMAKHGITDEDLEDAGVRLYWIRYKTEYERRLIRQLAYKYLGSGHSFGCVGTYSNRPRENIGVECTPAQYIEIEADFEFYRAALAEEMDIFYSAFLQKNDLFPPPELADQRPSDDDEVDMERIEKMLAMMGGIEHRTRHKALPESGEGDRR